MDRQQNNSLSNPVSYKECILSSTLQDDSFAIHSGDMRLVFEPDVSGISHYPGDESFHRMYSILEDESLYYDENEEDTTVGSTMDKESSSGEIESPQEDVLPNQQQDGNIQMPTGSMCETLKEVIIIPKHVHDSPSPQDSNVQSTGVEIGNSPKVNEAEISLQPDVPLPSSSVSREVRDFKAIVKHNYNLRSRRIQDRPPKLELQTNILTTVNIASSRSRKPPVLKRMVP